MEHLYLMLTELYSEKDFRIIEIFERFKNNKKSRKIHRYEIYVEDRVSEEFKTFEELEDYVFNLYKKECVIQAENIVNKHEETND
ncbi:MAG: hypothetical protein WC516_09670 [Patescibacteria group bacterium]|jgi:uncharacterized protein (UPF0248 family)